MINEFYKRFLSSIILIPIVLFCIIKGSILFNFFLVICFFITFYEWNKISKNKIYNIVGFFFLFFSFYSIFELRNSFYGDYHLVIFTILICISTDIGGYIFGKILKGPKLTKISPNKTISGAIGSLVFSSVFAIIFIYFLTKNFDTYVVIIGFITSIGCQIGDLLFSYLKRKASLKDTGNFLPGHGGILDRIDGILIGMPVGFLSLLIIY